MRILAVCGFGVGSSMVLKMTLDKACKVMGIEADVENMDISSARGERCDAIFTSYELAETLGVSAGPIVIPVLRYMDIEEIKAGLKKLLEEEIK